VNVELERRRLVFGYTLTVVGLFLAYVVAEVIPTPGPPACYTAECTAADLASLIGLFAIVLGMLVLAIALFRRPPSPASGAPAFPGSQYSFAPALPGGGPSPSAPPAVPPPAPPAVQNCPACGAPVTSSYGFCPRCGSTLSK
jgi:hypothetical protein